MIYLLLVFSLYFTDNIVTEDIIKWNEQPQISWSHFKGKPDPSSPYDAQLNSGVRYTYSYESKNGNVKIGFDVFSYMDSKSSWSKHLKQTTYLLNHEQLHFDISELHARILKKAFQETKFPKDPLKEIEKIFNRISKERQEMQNKYDRESDHSKNSAQQAKWEEFVGQQLINLDAYK
jgi:Fe-S cluster biosynthesis and repair protein YggX